jgi:GNAT superfamily N-acetyltransferase
MASGAPGSDLGGGRVEVTIRRAGPGDAAALADLYLRARKAAAHAGSIPPAVHSDDETSEWMAEVVIPRLAVWVAEGSDRQAAGMLVLDGPWIEQLYVDPPFTGRGIGTRLLAHAKRESPAELRLWTFASNEGAQRFYERHGFVPVQRTDGSGNEERAPDIEYVFFGGRGRS